MTIRIGDGQGFYGDGVAPVADVLESGVDYLVCEALAELTLAILQKDRQRDESLGFTRDLPQYVRTAIPYLADGRTKMITNAGGINPVAAGRAVVATLKAAGISGLTVATVVGDDVRAHAATLGLPDDTLFANVYLGAKPIADALDQGADIVVTGRVADASLFVAPMVHHYGWKWNDWDRLAAGVAIGHLLECSGQVAGGNYSGPWWTNPDAQRIGFPIGEVDDDGSAVITKSANAGGMITFDTVREQLLYEVQDPRRYLNPDATADFTSLTLDDLGNDRVRVSGVKGAPAPETYKGLVCRPAGWLGESTFTYSWPDAEAKARAAVRWLKQRAIANGVPIEEWCEEYFGAGVFHGPAAAADLADAAAAGFEPPEVMGRLAWRTNDEAAAGKVAPGSGVLGLSGPPMIAGFGRSRGGKPTQLLSLDSIAVPRPLVDDQVRIELTTV